ncbi:DsbA family protein [Granulicella sibirica]|uniref:DsbA oxidoreductase n=1 Tax=Granulicella sibirica TaxID=2479048 RepID=A0A4Q0T8R8_9BACT|nr:thioredoxin domain-containing protein [Granulicella sibirica]RXH58429.1 DsbA oxidoreductase [Granulicella sibirica]
MIKFPQFRNSVLAFALTATASHALAQYKSIPDNYQSAEPITTLGSITAPVSIVAFIDLECPFSAATVPLIEAMAKAHPDQIHLQIRQFPLDQHTESQLAHEAALAAGAQGRYFDMVDLIQANQRQMTREQYLLYAASLHLDLPRFKRDLDSHRFLPQVRNEVAEGNAIGVNQTPSLFINGKLSTGSVDAPTLASLVKAAIPTPSPSEVPRLAATPEPSPVIAKDLWQQMLSGNPTALGPTDAPVTIVEFTDFQCPFCRRSIDPLHQLIAASGGKVRWVYRSFPLDIHENSEIAAEAALAAGAQGKFWPMHDLLFAQQDVIDRAHIDTFARQIGLDMARFQADLASGNYRAAIASDRVLGNQAGVDGTPSFFINGHALTGARSLPELQQAVALAASEPGMLAPVQLATRVPSDAQEHLIAGTPQSSNSILWFSDVEASAAPAIGHVVQNLLEQQGPQLRVILKSYALPGHANAALTHRALLAASNQNRFWPFYYLLAGQTLPSSPNAARTRILAAAKEAGLDTTTFIKVLDSPEFDHQIEADHLEATSRGVRGVPVLILNGKRVDGIQPLALYEDYLHTDQAAIPAN